MREVRVMGNLEWSVRRKINKQEKVGKEEEEGRGEINWRWVGFNQDMERRYGWLEVVVVKVVKVGVG